MTGLAGVRLRQVGVALLGVLVAAIMVALGLWQLGVYSSQGTAVAQRRADAARVDLLSVAAPGSPVGDVYGRTVTVTGNYDPALQLLVPVDGDNAGRERVLTGLRLPSGGAVPVIRGLVAPGTRAAPTPPSGTVTVTGVFLPSEPNDSNTSLGGGLTSVQLPALAQRWSPTLVNGFVTLPADQAEAQGLAPAAVTLPQGRGRAQNAAYALQWWIFAGFALLMAARMSRDIGRRADYEYIGELDELGADSANPDN